MTRLAVLLALLVACKQGIGQRCQVDEDCAGTAVTCNTATGTCQAEGSGSVVNGDAGLPPIDAPDAAVNEDAPGSDAGSGGSGSDGSGSDGSGSDGSGSDGSGSGSGSGSGG